MDFVDGWMDEEGKDAEDVDGNVAGNEKAMRGLRIIMRKTASSVENTMDLRKRNLSVVEVMSIGGGEGSSQ